MSSLKKRVERLERAQGKGGVAIIILNDGETREEAWQRYLAKNPGAEDAGAKIFIQGPPSPDSPCGPPPPGTPLIGLQPQKSPWVQGTGPIMITD
jgi:hypothetical protein